MPNHVTNVLTASPAVIDAITRHYTDEEKAEKRAGNARGEANYKANTGKDWPYVERDARALEERIVDFELVLPMPPDDDPMFTATKVEGGWMMDGYSGLEWARDHWGTKWNAYDSEVEALPGDLCRVRFSTAWSHPFPVVIGLSIRFPHEKIEVEWADEDLGSNVGSYWITGGEITNLYEPEYGDDSLDMAARIKYGKTYAELRAEWGEDD